MKPWWRPSRLVLRIYLVTALALVAVIAVIIFGRSRREPQPFPGRMGTFLVEILVRDSRDDAGLAEDLARLRQETRVDATVYTAAGRLRASTEAVPPPPIPRDELDDFAKRRRRSNAGPGPREGVVVLDDKGGHAIIRSERQRPQGPDFRFDIVLVFFALGVASLVLARMIGTPLAHIAGVARRFGRGELGVRVALERADELGELAGAFDEMADRLTHLLRAQRELLASVSHELRTPLSRIRVALDLAAEGDSEAAREALRDISEDLAELEELVSDVLAMARLDAEGGGARNIPRLRTQPVDARALAERAAARFVTAHPERPLERALGEAGFIEADPNLLRRVIENLLENAHKYSPNPTAIRLAVAPEADGVRFTVSDHGQGIGPEDLPHVFEPFFRADRSRTRGTGGVGLGLALSKRVVEAHGGRIEIESAVDQGTTVSFVVPAGARNIS